MRIPITFDYRNRGAKLAKNDLRALGKSFLKATVGITSASVALERYVALLKASVEAAAADDKSQRILNRTLANSGWGAATQQVNDYIAKTEKATGIADDQLRPAFSKLFLVTKDATAAQQLLTKSFDYAAGTGKDLDTVVTALQKALAGQRKGLTQLGTGLDATFLKTASLTDIIDALDQRFVGQSAAAVASYAGQIGLIQNAVDRAKEALGYTFIDALGKASTSTNELADSIVNVGKALGYISAAAVGPLVELVNILTFKGSKMVFDPRRGKKNNAYTSNPQLKGLYKSDKTQNTELLKTLKKIQDQQNKAANMAAAKSRAAAAQQAKKLELQKAANQLAMQFDLERIGIAAALARTQDESTKNRLEALMKLNSLQYQENSSLSEMQALIDQINALMAKLLAAQQTAITQQQMWTSTVTATASEYQRLLSMANQAAIASLRQGITAGLTPAAAAAGARYAGQGQLWYDQSILSKGQELLTNAVATASLAQGQAAGLSLADSLAGARYAAQGANQYAQSQQAAVTINVGGSIISENDLRQVVANAINEGARSGQSLSRILDRL